MLCLKYYNYNFLKSKKIHNFRDVNVLDLNLIELKQKSNFFIVSNYEVKEYYCFLNNLDELTEFLNEKDTLEKEDDTFYITGVITFKVNFDDVSKITNFIFLEDVYVSGSLSLTSFFANECIFLKDIRISSCKETSGFSVSFANSLFKSTIMFYTEYTFKEIFFHECEFNSYVFLRGMNIKKLIFEFSDISGVVDCEDMYISGELRLSGNTLNNSISFYNSILDADVTFELNEFTKKSELNIVNCSFYKRTVINFEKFEGTFKVFDSIFTANCFLNTEKLLDNNYEALRIYDQHDYSGLFDDDKKLETIRELNIEKTKLNFYQVSEICKSNGNIEFYLDTYFQHKVYERIQLKDNLNKKATDYIKYYARLMFEKSTRYCTDWKRCFTSITIVIIFSSLIYSLFPCYLSTNVENFPKGNIIIWIRKVYLGEFLWPSFSQILNYIGTTLYYGVITFTTIGYGDISPKGGLRFIASLEGFLGVFMTSLFGVAVTKRYLG